MRESGIEDYLVEVVRELGGETRKVQWVGHSKAPDRLVMVPASVRPWLSLDRRINHTIWVELKNPETIKTFPANAHERAQHREHERMRALGQTVLVLGTKEQIDEAFR